MPQWSYWMQNAVGGTHTLVDMGNVDEQSVRDATDRVKAKIGRGAQIQVVGNGRVTLRIPPKKVQQAMADFPEIVADAAGYCWCSHGWRASGS